MSRTVAAEDIGPDFAPRRRPDVASVEMDGEAVLYAGSAGMHKLDRVATVLWNCFDGSVTVRELVADLDDVYPDADRSRIEADVLACVRQLGRQGLLAGVAAAEPPEPMEAPGATDAPGAEGEDGASR